MAFARLHAIMVTLRVGASKRPDARSSERWNCWKGA